MKARDLVYQYLEKSTDLAKKDMEKLEQEADRYAQLASLENIREIIKMKEDDFDLVKNCNQRVELDFVIRELTNVLFRYKLTNKRKTMTNYVGTKEAAVRSGASDTNVTHK